MDASDKEVIVWNRKIPEDILKEIVAPKEVPAESVTVWIDPLDATQEYTGESQASHYPFLLEPGPRQIVYTWWQSLYKSQNLPVGF